MKEKQIEKYLTQQCETRGWTAFKFSSPGHRGVPDRIITMPGGKLCFVECKGPKGKTTMLQERTLNRLATQGHWVAVVKSYGEVDELISWLEERLR